MIRLNTKILQRFALPLLPITHKSRPSRAGSILLAAALAISVGAGVLITASPAFATTDASDLGYPNATAPCQFGTAGGTSCTNPNDSTDKYDWFVDENNSGANGGVAYSGTSENNSPRLYYYRNCTDYVAWKLESLGVATSKTRGRGNGGDWDNSSTGVTLTTTPEIGDAAVWQPTTNNPAGHVAFVEDVRPKTGGGYEVKISEYNYGSAGTGEYRYWVQADNYVDFNGVGTPLGGSGGGSTLPPIIGSSARSDVDKNLGSDLFLVTPNGTGSSGQTLLSTYVSFIASQFNWNGGVAWNDVTPMVGDVNGDKRADLVYLTNEGANGTRAYVATANTSGFNPPQQWWNGTGWGYGGIKPTLGDVDGNGGEDLVITTNETGGSKAFVLLSTYGTFLSPQLWWDGTGWGWAGITPLVADVDHSGKADYILLSDESGTGTAAHVGTSNGSTFSTLQLWWNGTSWGYSGIKPVVGDVDGNGGADLVIMTNEASGFKTFALLSTYGTFLSPQLWYDGAGFGWSGVTPFVGDVNGNKVADLVFITNEGVNGTKAFTALSNRTSFDTPVQWWSNTSLSYSSIKAYLK
jgi:surface antigen